MWIDTHSHLYLPEFDADRDLVFQRAAEAGVQKIVLPNIDNDSLPALKKTIETYPNVALPLIGLHPTSVSDNVEADLQFVKDELQQHTYYGIGEIGVDLYWDTSRRKEQHQAFKMQLELAADYHLPVIIHIREAFDDVFSIIESMHRELYGIFHCFTGTYEQACRAIDLGFFLGIGGVVTFKNSTLPEVIKNIDLKYLVVETDAPYLTPHPHRGTRNESAYIPLIGKKIAEIKTCSVEEVASATTYNARTLFKL